MSATEVEIKPYPAAALYLKISSRDESGERVIEARIGEQIVGSMRVQVLPLVKDLEVANSFLARKIADALVNYVRGFLKASGFNEGMIMVAEGNEPMLRYIEKQATAEEPAKIFLMEVS